MIMRNCVICGKVYNTTNPTTCPECLEKDETDFAAVRNFIKDNPKVSIEVVSEATEVDEEKVERFLREGRLEAADLSGPLLQCERCGKPIYSGQHCVVCQSELRTTFKSGLSGKPKPESSEKKQTRSFAQRYRDGK